MSESVRGLIKQYQAFCEVAPYYVLFEERSSNGAITKQRIHAGFEIDVYGVKSGLEPGPLADYCCDRLKKFYKTIYFENVLAHTDGMGRPPLRITVTAKDQKELTRLLSGGVQQVRVVLRALVLRELAKGTSAPQIARVVPLTPQAIRKVGHRYQQGGLESALYEKHRPGAAQLLDESQKQRIIAMVCSAPPEGRARWTVRLVAEEAVKRKLVPRVGRETIRILLVDHDLKPWREKNVVRGRTQ